jgi:hypothetical protein
MRWTRQRRARNVMAGRASARERSAARRRTMLLRTVKPCGPGTRCWCQVGGGFAGPTGSGKTVNSQTTVTRRIRRRGERGVSRKTIVQGMPADTGEPVVTTVCLLPMHTGCGCIGHPAFPAPSVSWGERLHSPGASRRGDAKPCRPAWPFIV